MDPRQRALDVLAQLRRAITPAPHQTKETSAEIAEIAGIHPYRMSSISNTKEYEAALKQYEIEVALVQAKVQQQLYQQQLYANKIPVQRNYERHAIIQIKNEDGSNMLLDFDVQVHMEDGEFHSLIIAAADESVTILKDEFMRRLNEDDMLCKLIYKRIVKLKLLDQAPPPTAHPGSIIKQNGQVFMVASDGTLEPVNV